MPTARERLGEFRPNYFLPSVDYVTPALLQKHGIKGIALDLDGTLEGFWGTDVSDERRSWVEMMLAEGFRITIVSNIPKFYGKGKERLQRIANTLEVGCIAGRKPRAETFEAAVQQLQLAREEVAVIGDQLQRDICMGNRCGAGLTILVQPCTFWEFPGTMLWNRNVERVLRCLLSLKVTKPPPL